jgi:glycerol-3-phosphate dehydrogenase (NAD(P)+)
VSSRRPSEGLTVALLGAGGYGTALLRALLPHVREARIWDRRADLIATMTELRYNPRYPYLRRFRFPSHLRVTGSLEEALSGADLVVVGVSVGGLADVYGGMASVWDQCSLRRPVLLGVSKGITADGLLPDQVGRAALAGRDYAYVHLAGPAFAQDLVRGSVVGLVAASEDEAARQAAVSALSGPSLWVYPWHDVRGVEAAGALRTILSVVFGGISGFPTQVRRSTKAFVFSRASAEMGRFGLALGGDPRTFAADSPAGPATVGDLYLCDHPGSRNWQLGRLLASGVSRDEAATKLQGTAESVSNSRVIHDLAARMRQSDPSFELPWCEAVYQLCHQGLPVRSVVESILARGMARA